MANIELHFKWVMQNQAKFRIVVGVVLVVLAIVWLWPSDEVEPESALATPADSNELVSAIQPIGDKGPNLDVERGALTTANRLPEKQTLANPAIATEQDQAEFRSANQAIQRGDHETASQLLQGLIKRQPGLLEPYINLATSQAKAGQLEQARQTLTQGLGANENYAALYQNLQQVHAALAAESYKLALADGEPTQGSSDKSIDLPLISVLNPPVAPEDSEVIKTELAQVKSQLGNSKAQLQAEQEKLVAANQDIQSRQAQVEKLQLRLTMAESKADMLAKGSESSGNKVDELETKLTAAQQQISDMLLKHEAEVAALADQLQQRESQLAEQQTLLAAATQVQVQPEQKAVVVEPTVSVPEPVTTSSQENANSLAIERVKSWAQAWSNQDVPAYIAHYIEGYSPAGSGLSNSQWRGQRQVRLTNKSFIEVTLSDFKSNLQDGLMVVSFTQRYRANTMDDTITKELRLRAIDDDWSRARITSERVLR